MDVKRPPIQPPVPTPQQPTGLVPAEGVPPQQPANFNPPGNSPLARPVNATPQLSPRTPGVSPRQPETAYRTPRSELKVAGDDEILLRTRPGLAGASRTRAWTGPSLPPFDAYKTAVLGSPSAVSPRFYSTTDSSASASPVTSGSTNGETMSPRERVLLALGNHQREERTPASEMNERVSGKKKMGYLVTGKGLKSGNASPLPPNPSHVPETPYIVRTAASPQPTSKGRNSPPPSWRSHASMSSLYSNLARRASSPSLAHTQSFSQAEAELAGIAVPRRASADSSIVRSSEDLFQGDDNVRRHTSSAGSVRAKNHESTKKRTQDEGARTSLRNLTGVSKIPASLASTGTLIKDKAIKHMKTPSGSKYEGEVVDILDVPPKEVARQLALMDSKVFREIPRAELASIAWTGQDKQQRAPQIVAATQHFNQVALWVAEQIVLAEKVKRRFQLVCHFIGVAKYCMDLNNFNGLRSITAGLQSTAVHRLERTWAMVGRREKAVFDKMCDLMSPLSNSDAYRRRLTETKPPCVPYLGVWLGDLTFLNECIKKEKDDPNRAQQLVERQAQMDALLDDISRYQQNSVYPQLEVVQGIQDAFSSFQLSQDVNKIEEDQYLRSKIVEPKITPSSSKGGGVDTVGTGDTTGSGKSGTIKVIRNRIRGNSASIRCEPASNAGLLELHIGDGASDDGSTAFSDTMVTDGSSIRTGSNRTIERHGSVQNHSNLGGKRSGSETSDRKQSPLGTPAPSRTPATPPARSTRDTKPLAANKMSAAAAAKRKARGHRRSKSGSAAVTYHGSPPASTPMTHRQSRLSMGSISDFLVSKGWVDENEEDIELMNDSRESDISSPSTSHSASIEINSRGRRLTSSARYVSASTTSNASSGVRRSSRSLQQPQLAAGDLVSTTDLNELVTPVENQGLHLVALDQPVGYIAPGSHDFGDPDLSVTMLPFGDGDRAENTSASFEDFTFKTCDIDCMTPNTDGGYDFNFLAPKASQAVIDQHPHINANHVQPHNQPMPLQIKRINSSPSSVASPASSSGSLNVSQSPMVDARDKPPILEGRSGSSFSGSIRSNTLPEPILQGYLDKKEELTDIGKKVPGRKWARAWVALYGNPPRLEIYQQNKADSGKSSPRDLAPKTPTSPTDYPSNIPTFGLTPPTLRAGSPLNGNSSSQERTDMLDGGSPGTPVRSELSTGSGRPSSPAQGLSSTGSPCPAEGERPSTSGPAGKALGQKRRLWHAMSGFSGSTVGSQGSGNARSRMGSTGSARGSKSLFGKSAEQEPPHLSLTETIPLLRQGNCVGPAHYKKRKHVLRLFPGPGARRTVLFYTGSDPSMFQWISALKSVVGDELRTTKSASTPTRV